MRRGYARVRREPALEAVLRDPVVRPAMRRDGLAPADVHRVVNAARCRLSPPREAGDRRPAVAR